MALREEKITIDGIQFTIRERSLAQQFELEKLEKVTIGAIYEQSITPFEKLNEVGVSGAKKIREVFNRVNSVDEETYE